MAKGQMRSNKEERKPKSNERRTTNAPNPWSKPLGIRST